MSLIKEALEKSALNHGKTSPLLKQEEMIEKDLMTVRLKAREQMMARRRLRMGLALLCVLGIVFGFMQMTFGRQKKSIEKTQQTVMRKNAVQTPQETFKTASFFSPAKPEFTLTGISTGAEGNIAIINGQTVQEGDFLGKFVILRISKALVTLKSQDKTIQLSL